MIRLLSILVFVLCPMTLALAGTEHGESSKYPSFNGLIMCGYQGWFRAPGDGTGDSWGHYSGGKKDFNADSLHLDAWPDVSDYPKTYPTSFKNADGSAARVFSSVDQSTIDVHFRWMKEYGIDGVFVQRFFPVLRTEERRKESRRVLEEALKASQKYGRAIALMYDLSGIGADGEDCSAVIADWKELIDQLHLTSQGKDQTYLYHKGKPLVAIWGLGFPDRPYTARGIGVTKLIDFLKHDPKYGGCSVLLGVPTYFRQLDIDTLPDPYLHTVMEKADIVMPWMVQRFTPLLQAENERYAAQIKADIAWCKQHRLEYVPCVYPGFSWYNLGRKEFGGGPPLNQIPRLKGKFYWDQISTAQEAGAKMIYVAMFDEMDEGTAIFKCTNRPPVGVKLLDMEGMPSDHYLWLTGQAARMLRGEIPFTKTAPNRPAN